MNGTLSANRTNGTNGNNGTFDLELFRGLTKTIAFFAGLSILLNLLVIYKVLRKKIRKCNKFKLYCGSLAVADLLLSVSNIVFSLYSPLIITVIDEKIWNIVLSSWGFMTTLSYTAGLFHAILITVDRSVATLFPMFHKVNVTRKICIIALFFIWVFSISISLIQFWQKTKFTELFIAISGITGTLVFIIAYSLIIGVVYRQKQLRRDQMCTNRSENQISSLQRPFNTTYLGIAITAAFIICNLSYSIVALMDVAGKIPVVSSARLIALLMVLLNATINPIIYTVAHWLRKTWSHKTITDRRKIRAIRFNSAPMEMVNISESDILMKNISVKRGRCMSLPKCLFTLSTIDFNVEVKLQPFNAE